MKKADIVLAGVGGQGIVLASDILAEAGVVAGYDVKKSDVIGMAQRGGEVISHVRLGEKVHSPLIRKGGADFLLAFEKLEAARRVEYLQPGGVAIVNDQRILPLSVSSGGGTYPGDEQIQSLLASRTHRIFLVNGLALAEELKSLHILNVLLLGVLSHFLPIEREIWNSCIAQRVPPKFVELNLTAFATGQKQAERICCDGQI